MVPLTCQTPDVTVPMGSVNSRNFTGVGSVAGTKPFNLALNNCPSGINSVKYRIDPSTAYDAATSVIALTSSGSPGTATGVGLQLRDNAGNPLPLAQDITFSGYDPAGGSFNIPLQAAYYQNGSSVGPGLANASVQFTMTYQ
ncbi:fimbrial protein [Burkholderia ubonensis]|uniref:fimbrial protein n=1 Tax=Burkholderia ubonensis TaxID=101571 RepID=UPI0012F730EE|nr:fimbrial protein [Burkholderia ubonensis]